MSPLEALEQVREAAYRARLKWPGNSDGEKNTRTIVAYEKGYVVLVPHYGESTTLKMLDPNKGKKGGGRPTMFSASERNIRRVKNIRTYRSPAAAMLESAAMRGELSLELVEWVVMHPPSADTLEAIWLAADGKAQDEFLARIRRA